MGEPRSARPAVAAAANGARWWSIATRTQRAVPTETLDHADFYDLAAELVSTLRALGDLADALARQAGQYGRGRRLRDDAGKDPTVRLARAMAEASSLRVALATAVCDGERFWSAIGHVGLELSPDDDPEPFASTSDTTASPGEES